MDAIAVLKKELEIAFLQQLITMLRNGEITTKDSRAVIRDFLSMFPMNDLSDSNTKIAQFIAFHKEFKPMTLIVSRHEDAEQTNSVLSRMRQHMQSGNIDEALAVAEKHA